MYCICVFLAVLLAFPSWDTYCQALVSAWVLLQVWTVVEWPWPTTFKQQQQFEFCKRLPQINFSCTKALTSKRNASFTRRAKVGQVFSRIKVHIYHCPVLRNPDPLHSCIVEDTFEVGHLILCDCKLHMSSTQVLQTF